MEFGVGLLQEGGDDVGALRAAGSGGLAAAVHGAFGLSLSGTSSAIDAVLRAGVG